MSENQKVKVGDQLAFKTFGGWSLRTVTEITPSGRIRCGKTYELNPDLSVRGRWDSGMHGRIPTPEILADIRQRELTFRLRRRFAEEETMMPLETLEKIAELAGVLK